MTPFSLLAILLWGLTSVLKIPAFAGLTLAFVGVYVWQFKSKSKSLYHSHNKFVFGYFLSAALLACFLSNDIFPPNISALAAGLIGFFVINSEGFHKCLKKIWLDTRAICASDIVATCVFLIAFFAILFAGSYYSLGVGLSWDEHIEQQTFLKSVSIIGKGLSGDSGYFEINDWGDRYYGIGFYFPFYIFHRPFMGLIRGWFDVSNETAILMSRHLAVFWLFAFSSTIVSRIVYLLTKNLRYAYLVGGAYLICPYFLGHGLTNVKDAPFACVWILCSYLLIKLVNEYLTDHEINRNTLISLVLSISWLITVRISGVLFFVPLFVAFMIIKAPSLLNHPRVAIRSLLSSLSGTKRIYALIFCSFAVVAMMYPVVWQDPSELFKAVRYMGKHPWGGCTLTYGECMVGQALPYSYIPAWLMVKLPLASLLGLLVIPLGLYFEYVKNSRVTLKIFSVLFIPALLIPILLVLKNTVLYDELRQLLFLVATFFIVGFVSIFYCSRNLAFALVTISIAIFSLDNIKIYPHQLSWFNEIARHFNLNGKYETDYWGNGLSQLAKYINKHGDYFDDMQCIYADPVHLFTPFLDNGRYRCIKSLSEVNKDTPRPFAYAKYSRSSYKASVGCVPVLVNSISPSLSSSAVVVGEVGICK